MLSTNTKYKCGGIHVEYSYPLNICFINAVYQRGIFYEDFQLEVRWIVTNAFLQLSMNILFVSHFSALCKYKAGIFICLPFYIFHLHKNVKSTNTTIIMRFWWCTHAVFQTSAIFCINLIHWNFKPCTHSASFIE